MKPSGVEFDEYVSCDASVSVCEIQSVDWIMQDHLTCEEEEGRGRGGGGGLIENKVCLMLFKD